MHVADGCLRPETERSATPARSPVRPGCGMNEDAVFSNGDMSAPVLPAVACCRSPAAARHSTQQAGAPGTAGAPRSAATHPTGAAVTAAAACRHGSTLAGGSCGEPWEGGGKGFSGCTVATMLDVVGRGGVPQQQQVSERLTPHLTATPATHMCASPTHDGLCAGAVQLHNVAQLQQDSKARPDHSTACHEFAVMHADVHAFSSSGARAARGVEATPASHACRGVHSSQPVDPLSKRAKENVAGGCATNDWVTSSSYDHMPGHVSAVALAALPSDIRSEIYLAQGANIRQGTLSKLRADMPALKRKAVKVAGGACGGARQKPKQNLKSFFSGASSAKASGKPS